MLKTSAVTAPLPARIGGTRIGLIGDSLMQRGFSSNAGNDSCTLSVLSASEIQVTQSGYALTPGNKVTIIWCDQPLLNGYCTTILRLIDSSNFTIANPGVSVGTAIGIFSGKSTIACYSLTHNKEVGFTPWILATQSSGLYYNVFSVNAMVGATSTQVDTYCVTNALKIASYPDEWWYLTGANDVGTFTVDQTMANVQNTMSRLLGTGKTVRLFTPSAYNGTASYSAFLQELRQQQIETYKNNPQVIIFDLNKWMIDPTSLTGDMKSGYSADGVHPSITGCYQAAKGFWTDMAKMLPSVAPLFPVSQMDSYAYANGVGYSNLMTNPMLIGTGGAVSGVNASGSAATSWNVYNNGMGGGLFNTLTCTANSITNPNGGFYQKLVGVMNSNTVTMSIASPCVVTWAGHGLSNNTPIAFTTTGALPTGVTAGVIYFVKFIDANTFNLSTTLGGSALNTSGTQSGVHSAAGAGQATLVCGADLQIAVNANIKTPNNMGAGWFVIGAEVNIPSQPTSVVYYISGTADYSMASPNNSFANTVRMMETTADPWVAALSGGQDTFTILSEPFYIDANGIYSGAYSFAPTFIFTVAGPGTSTFQIGRPFMRRINM